MNKDLGTLSGTLLIFGGPYSNLAALKAMRAQAEQSGIPPGNIICTGDIVAYCAEPQQTIDLIREWGVHIVQGNCEESLANDRDDCGCGFGENSACDLASKEWFSYARKHVSAEAKQWMATLPERMYFNYEGRRYCCIHGGLEEQNQFVFQSTEESEKLRQLKAADADVMIAGHCGLPFGQQLEDSKYWLNAGVIGMPAHDGQPNTWYMLLGVNAEKSEAHLKLRSADATSTCRASWHALHYDYQSSIKSMHAAQLCPGYSAALASGLWPNDDILPAQERKKSTRIPPSLINPKNR